MIIQILNNGITEALIAISNWQEEFNNKRKTLDKLHREALA